MIIDIPFKEGDSKKFLTSLNGLAAHLATEFCPKEVYVKRIPKWFDQKWLRYLGNGLIPFPQMEVELLGTECEPSEIEAVALEEQYQERLPLPPFNPRQIGFQYYWPQGEDGSYDEGIGKPRWTHMSPFNFSSPHLQNRVASSTDSGIYVWFSSNTQIDGKGSIMAYLVKDGKTQAWYASLVSQSGWKIEKVEGINIKTLEDWFQN